MDKEQAERLIAALEAIAETFAVYVNHLQNAETPAAPHPQIMALAPSRAKAQ